MVILQELLFLLSVSCRALLDTSEWIGAEYTPARAGNQLWWWYFDEYVDDLHRELGAAQKHYGMTTLRMFLHSMLYDADSEGLKRNMTRFLNISASYGIKVGVVLFGKFLFLFLALCLCSVCSPFSLSPSLPPPVSLLLIQCESIFCR